MRLAPWGRRGKGKVKGLKHLLLACTDPPLVATVHALLITSGFIENENSIPQLISSYARVGQLNLAHQVFDKLPHRKIGAWNSLIIAYSRKDCPAEVINLYSSMCRDGVKPDSSTFTMVIKACASLLDLDMGEEVRLSVDECGYQHDLFVSSSFLNLYTKCGRMDMALSVFETMHKKDLVSWTTMIMGFAQSGQAIEAITMCRKMQEAGVKPDSIVMLGLIQACANLDDRRIGFSIHGSMIRRDLSMDVLVQTSLVDMYAKMGRLHLASLLFQTIPTKSVVSWSAMISGYAQNGFANNALELLREMFEHGFEPDPVSLIASLLACSQLGCFKLGRSVHGYVIKTLSYNFDQVRTTLIDMYSKCGSLSSGKILFNQIVCKDTALWNTIIASFGVHGHGKEAHLLFLQMIKSNSEPDNITFASLLSAFSHSGLVEEGKYWFGVMVNEFKIEPCENHYACMVDLFSRAGMLKEALDLISTMKNEPGIATWVSLLSGCCNHRNIPIGMMVVEKVLKLKIEEPGVYTLVSNFFAIEKNWNKVAWIRKEMRRVETKKTPGYSTLEVDGDLHVFVVEDKRCFGHEELAQMLERLEEDMRMVKDIPVLDPLN